MACLVTRLHVRSPVYSPAGRQFTTLDALEGKIREVLEAIPEAVPLEKFLATFRDFPQRCEQCQQPNGDLFEE